MKMDRRKNRMFSPIPRGGRRVSSSAFLSRRPFGYYLPLASYGTIFAAKWSINGGLEAVVSKRLAQVENELFHTSNSKKSQERIYQILQGT